MATARARRYAKLGQPGNARYTHDRRRQLQDELVGAFNRGALWPADYKSVIFNNGSLGMARQWQSLFYDLLPLAVYAY